ncbi:MAG: GTP 3',8-cyclase MoaA [Acidobacteriota bacterium]|nr:GTP 3',8-cyclase MoaA [Acidobacteriota bacterium]
MLCLLTMLPVLDQIGRPLRSLRISVTDRCNLRCQYCMPEEDYVWLERDQLLSYEEIAELTTIFTELGVEKVRLTGGEPLLRRDLDRLIRLLAGNPRLRDLALTTNGVLLAEQAHRLHEAGLHRLTVSLDTLRPQRFRAFTRRDLHGRVLEGIRTAKAAGFHRMKINAVIIRGFNDDELPDLIEFGKQVNAEVRFIEYMDVGGATRWSMDQVVTSHEMLRLLCHRYGPIQSLQEQDAAPANRYRLPDGTTFGIICSMSQPFCRSCDRARLTIDGVWFLCLYARDGVDLKRLLRGGASREEIARKIVDAWQARMDRGAEERLQLRQRDILFAVDELRADPHREMHTRGG